jgi:hypothetical protein
LNLPGGASPARLNDRLWPMTRILLVEDDEEVGRLVEHVLLSGLY